MAGYDYETGMSNNSSTVSKNAICVKATTNTTFNKLIVIKETICTTLSVFIYS